MKRPQPDLAPRRDRKSGDRVRIWLSILTVVMSVSLAGTVSADEDDDRSDWEWEFERLPVGRAQLIPVDTNQGEPTDDAYETESDEPEQTFLFLSASQDSPYLVPLPEPQLVPALPPVPLPPANVPEPIPGPEGVPATPFAPALDPFCAECLTGRTAITSDRETLLDGILVKSEEDRFGIGSRQVPFATFHIDPVSPLSQLRLRADFANGLKTPDRAERFWAAPPEGPSQPENKVNYQTFSLYNETGSDTFSAFTEIPLLSLNPDINGDTTGLGNLVVGQKFLLTNRHNRHWQIAQILRTYLPTGASSRGLGNGLVALEPGLLFRYRVSELTYFHGELKYWMPLSGDPQYSGNILQYGTAMSHVLWQTDERAVMSTLELLGTTIGNGQATLPDGTLKRVNGETFFSLLPGLRMALGPSGDLGLLELGLSAGMTFGDPGWYDSRFLFDVRWSY